MREIKFKKIIPEATVPYRKYDLDAGFDFYCTSREIKFECVVYHTGIAVEIPEGMVGLAFPRSSVVKTDLMLKNSVGVIDSTYRGEIIFIFEMTKGDDGVIYEIGDRVGQLVFIDLPIVSMVEVNELSETTRGTGGFGHTGK